MTRTTNRELRDAIGQRAGSVYVDTTRGRLVYYSIRRGESELSDAGAVVATTGKHTGRAAGDKLIVVDGTTRDTVWWDNARGIEPAAFDRLLSDMTGAVAGRELFAQRLHAGADRRHRLQVEVITPSAWHALFIQNLLIVPDEGGTGFEPEVLIVHLPDFHADPARHGTRSQTAIAIDMSRRIILIAGTAYAGEIKKSVFSLFSFLAPGRGVLPMHCAANQGEDGATALLFGLSGTGKTTLSADPDRVLIGDDEHGWSEDSIFNVEGGCYAKVINLSEAAEPQIHAATRRFGTVLENVGIDAETGRPDFADAPRTQNTRAAYGLDALERVSATGAGPVPRAVVFLTADAFGVMPPAARLTTDQAIYHFLSGYTAKIPGTEQGVSEPMATFSACFGAPFMALHPTVYGGLLRRRLEESGAACWMINTGWTGGAYGTGRRFSIATTRRLLGGVLSGALTQAPMRVDRLFGFAAPTEFADIEPGVLDPRAGWASGEAYDEQARRLVSRFIENFDRLGAEAQPLAAAGPSLSNAA